MESKTLNPKPYGNPYLAGVLLGLTLFAAFLVLGTGLGASGAMARLGAFLEGTVAPNPYALQRILRKMGRAPSFLLSCFHAGRGFPGRSFFIGFIPTDSLWH